MINVLIATYEYPPDVGGIATYLSYFAERFPSGRVSILAPEHDAAHTNDMDSPAIIYRRTLSSSRLRPRWLPALYWTWWMCRKERPHALIVSHVLPMGQVARFVKTTLGIPYVVVLHGMDVASAVSAGGRKKAAAGRALKDADLIVTNSAYTALWLATYGLDPAKAVVVPPPPSVPLEDEPDPEDRRAMRSMLGVSDDTFVMVSVGRLVRRKGFDTAIRAASKLATAGRKIRYVIVGAGPDRERLEHIVAELDVAHVVSFMGGVDTHALASAYAAADAFIMTPRAEGPDVEGFGIVYLEAGLMRLPVIGSRTGGVPEAVRHETTGLLVDPDDADGTAKAIERLMDDPEMAKRLGAAGRARVLEEFGEDRQAKRFMAAVKTLIR